MEFKLTRLKKKEGIVGGDLLEMMQREHLWGVILRFYQFIKKNCGPIDSMNFGIYQEKIKHFNLEWLSNVWNFYSCISVRLDWNEKLKLFHYSTYFCYYS